MNKHCDECKLETAQITVKSIHDGVATERHLCPSCTSKYAPGLSFQVAHPAVLLPSQLLGALAPIVHALPVALGPGGGEALACAACRYSIKQLQQTGKLGCPRCYESFAPHIQLILRRSQGGATRHRGKQPVRLQGQAVLERQLAALRARRDEAVKAERYEEAAVLRDQIRALEQAALEVLKSRCEIVE
jgi:protein arginine kinase activator